METRSPTAAPASEHETRLSLWPGQNLLIIALWLGCFGGLLEVAGIAFQKLARGGLTHRGLQVVWMAPAAQVIILLLLGAILFVLGLRWRRLQSTPVAVGVFTFVVAWSAFVLPGWLALWSAGLLAAGLAFQVARWSAAREASVLRLARRTTPLLVAVIGLLAIAVNMRLVVGERRALAALPPATPESPNVILVVWDVVRARNLSLYGYHRPTTPNLDRFARDGVVFDHAIATAPWTLPSHAGMFTGRFHHQLDLGWATPFHEEHPTLAGVLASNGYRTGGFVGNILYTDREHGLSRGFLHYKDRPLTLGSILDNSSIVHRLSDPTSSLAMVTGPHRYLWHKTAEDINAQFLTWAKRDRSRPFFAFLNYFDAHDPYLPPRAFARRFGDIQRPSFFQRLAKLRRGQGIWDLDQREAAEEERAYDASIAYLDHAFGKLIRALREGGLLDNTLILVTSDHGEEFGEHGEFTHGHTLYMPALHVPLVLHLPSRIPAGVRVAAPVSLRDVPATVFDVIRVSHGRAFPGEPLSAFWRTGGAPNQTPVLSSTTMNLYGHNLDFSLMTDRHHFIQQANRTELIFDWQNDPDEKTDIAATDREAILSTLRARLNAARAANQAPTIVGSTPHGCGPAATDRAMSSPCRLHADFRKRLKENEMPPSVDSR